MNFDFGKILYEALFSISRGCKDIGGFVRLGVWGVLAFSAARSSKVLMFTLTSHLTTFNILR